MRMRDFLNAMLRIVILQQKKRIHFNKHIVFHFNSSTDTITYPFSNCKHNNIIFNNANTYSVYMCRIHSTDEGTGSKQNKGSEIMNSENPLMNVDVEHENEFQGTQLDKKFQLLSDVSSDTEEVPVIMQVHGSKLPEVTKTLAELCLNLTTHHYGSEPIVQKVVQKTSQAFTTSKEDFFSTLDTINTIAFADVQVPLIRK